jgi:hypothetical protein
LLLRPIPILINHPGWLAFMGVFTYLLVPETKGVPIEVIEDKFRQHWFWKRVMAKTDAAEAAAAVTGAGGGHEPVCKVTTTSGARGFKGKDGLYSIQL